MRNSEHFLARKSVSIPTTCGDVFFLGLLGWSSGLAGNRGQAPEISSALEHRRLDEYVSGFALALDQAIGWLQHGVEERDGLMTYLHAWPTWDPLRADPRFQALLRRMNFPGPQQRAGCPGALAPGSL